MDRIDCTITGVADPGLRPTASDAFPPINPTARAAPSAAIATVMLPTISSAPFSSLVCRRLCRFVMLADQQREDGGQQHEHERLHQTDQQLHEVKRNLHEPAENRYRSHRLEHRFAGEHIAVEPE